LLAVGVANSHRLAEPELIPVDSQQNAFLQPSLDINEDIEDVSDITSKACIFEADQSFYNLKPLIKKDG